MQRFEEVQTLPTTHPMSTTDMQVTSIRLEGELKDRLKTLAGRKGYQALIREVLWHYVRQKSGEASDLLSATQISASVGAIAHQRQHCAVTGQVILPHEPMRLGYTNEGFWVPLSTDCASGETP